VLLGVLVLALAGCGSDDGESGSTSPTTPTTGEGFEFTGYVVRSQGATKICEALAESYPPQCGGTSYRVVGLDFSGVEGVEEASGVSWTEQPVTLGGVLTDDGATLVVNPNPAVGGEPPPPTVEGQPGSAPG
jgi:hypothetical protein